MDREEKKYEVLPGVKTPDIKSILEAASDFSNPGVEDLYIKGGDFRKTLAPEASAPSAPTAEDVAKLQNLGDEVAEDERRATEESRKKMEEIKKQVIAPESIKDLQKAAASKIVSEEKRVQLEKERAEKESKQAEEDAKNKAREERRLAQQKILEETQQKKAAAEAKAKREKEEEQLRKKKEELAKAEADKKAKEEADKKAKEEAEAKAKAEAEKKNNQKSPDDDYLAWVKAKREEASKKPEKPEAKKPESKPSVTPAPADTNKAKKEEVKDQDSQTLDDFSEFL